ncbi:alpha,alpha-trehalose phosphorylase [Virgibacillus natechei]|uniref:Alpha,alpha-trehalose phosphorylase n=1 Tax=Virgibacillus natechei TaxID=1216297 RepID=A0ABS4IK94_9BACI|nr:glycoside hydrolase family 65 protein [Virgibacillus natechei]MBP1971356.1 alpha,alpha-trehalose phosphorylase [Virgibacillus natechei]UZD12909.1 glycoside hydrolase family 65 protein [Virgibacillus natechei]
MAWAITKSELDHKNLLINESLLSLGNGYLGVRGNFEEGYDSDFQSIRGTYINAFHDETEITYGEKQYAFPDKQQKLLNVIDAQTVQIYVDGDRFSLFSGEIVSFERTLHLDKGYSERKIHWKSPNGKEVQMEFRRLVSFVTRELFAIDIKIEPLNDVNELKIISRVDGDVSNFTDENDPRVASGHAKRLFVSEAKMTEGFTAIKDTTFETQLDVTCITSTCVDKEGSYNNYISDSVIEEEYKVKGPVRFSKYNVYTDSLRYGENVLEEGIKIQHRLANLSFEELMSEQKEYLDNFWKLTDVKIDGDKSLQEGIRFNLYQLLQSVGKDPISNIASKGLSGEGYEGHYFWDTEIYMLPVFLMTNPAIAKNLLLHRYSLLNSARERAREMGHENGALFPWRTITGGESSAFFPAGTAQYHINADIAYSYIQYYLVTRDEEFLKDYMVEVLVETARLWIDTGHFKDGQFRIDDVTGPDEYTCIVNNNYYTNVMAKHNLLWAVKVFRHLKETNKIEELSNQLNLNADEVELWEEAGEKMFLPYDENLGIHAQDDSFLKKARWNLENTNKENFPLLLHYHPLTLYRYQVCKQADTVLGHFLLEDEADIDTIRQSYDYYEAITTHDSSLSYCVFSIMASKLGYEKKAYSYFNKTARLDLENRHGNTKDGLHMANMGGAWLAIVYGFAGLRVKESGLSMHPRLPKQWNALEFHLRFRGRVIQIKMENDIVCYTLVEGNNLTIQHREEEIHLEQGIEIRK